MREARPSIPPSVRPVAVHSLVLLAVATVLACGGGSPDAEEGASEAGIGLTLAREGHIEAAMEHFHALARQDPRNRVGAGQEPPWLEELVNLLLRRRRVDLADSLVTAVGPLGERSPGLRHLSANLLVLQGRSDEAVAAYESVIAEESPLSLLARHELATLHLAQGRPARAIEAARAALGRDPERGALRVLIAQALVAQGRPRAGLAELAALPASSARWTAEGEILLDALDRPDSAAVVLEQALRAAPQVVNVRYLLGRALLGAGDADRAARALEPLALRDPPFERSRALLARAWRAQGRHSAADSLEAEVARTDRAERVRELRTEGLRRSVAGELEAALVRFEEGLELDPRHADLHNDRGVVLARLGRFDVAETAFRRAEELAPDDPTVQLNLARLYERTGNNEARDRALALHRSLTESASPRR